MSLPSSASPVSPDWSLSFLGQLGPCKSYSEHQVPTNLLQLFRLGPAGSLYHSNLDLKLN